MSHRIVLAGILGMAVLAAIATRAQDSAARVSAAESDAPLDIRAGRMEYDEERRLFIGREGVVISHEKTLLRADYMEIHRDTRDVHAHGNVILLRPDGSEWRGVELTYNLRTGQGDFGTFTYRSAPFLVEARESAQETPRLIRLRGVSLTTCDQPRPREFEITSPEATITDRRYVRGRHAIVWLGPVPIFYLPFYRRDLRDENRWTVTPGYTSRLGPFLLIGYRYPLMDDRTWRGISQVNLYGRRGIGAEQSFLWRRPDDSARGEARIFGIRDQRLFRDEREREEREALLDDDRRHRLQFRHTQSLSPADTLYVDLTHLSDPWVTKDFLRREYNRQPIPDNRIVWQHTQPDYTLSLLLHRRLNNFYDNVDRMPEARLIIPAAPLLDSDIYYANETAAAHLERVHPRGSEQTDYAVTRVDTTHQFSYPGRYFGFLSLTPRAAWRGTWYSKTLSEPRSVTNTVTNVDEEGLEVTTTEVATTQSEEGATLRNVFELGLESSFKAFRVLDEGQTLWGNGLRHVAEPYARHTYIPEPNLTPERLYQFDSTDRLDRAHHIRFGLRNKLQTRRAGRTVHDLVDANLHTLFRIEKRGNERDFDTINADVRLRPDDGFRLDFDGQYDPYESEITAFNARMTLKNVEESRWDLEYRYRANDRNQVLSEVTLLPRRPWTFGFSHRFDADEGRLEEHGYWVRRRMTCVGWSIGFTHEPARDTADRDDYRVWFRLWLLALPEWGVDIGG